VKTIVTALALIVLMMGFVTVFMVLKPGGWGWVTYHVGNVEGSRPTILAYLIGAGGICMIVLSLTALLRRSGSR